jgi:DNA mismatch repair protein MutS
MKKYFVLLLVTFSFHLRAESYENSPYLTIQKLNLASLEWQEEEWPNESFNSHLQRALSYQENLQEYKKRKILFKQFHRQSKNKPHEHNVLADIKTVQDLNIFCGQKMHDPYVAQLVDRTQTSCGKVFLYGLIGAPTHHIQILEQRQHIIRYFLEQEQLRRQLRETYSTLLAPSENMVLAFWSQDDFFNASTRHYWTFPYFAKINKKLNSSEIFLLARSLLEHQRRAVSLVASVAATVILPVYGMSLLSSVKLPRAVSSVAQGLQGSGDRVLGLLSQVNDTSIACAALMAGGFYSGIACKEECNWAYDNFFIDECLQKKMMKVASFFEGLRKIKKLCDKNPELVQEVAGAKKIVEFFTTTARQNPDLKKLLKILKTETFKGKSSFLSHHGRILVAYGLMNNVKEEIEQLFMAVGELDAYSSVAALCHEYRDKRVHFCFPTYIVAGTPLLVMNEFWNPFIDSAKVVTNNLSLIGPADRNMIITGPNAGGKSTLIKATANNIILAQSLGIAAAHDMQLTPFYSIGTYLNVVDDIAGGNSLFKAQVARVQEIIEIVENTPKDQLSFVIVDEMFNGTSAKESKATAYSVAKHIGTFLNNICVVATHFPLLASLVTEMPFFTNYKVSVDVGVDGAIHYPFKLEFGISNQHIALDILRQEGYACAIVNEAAKLLEYDPCD